MDSSIAEQVVKSAFAANRGNSRRYFFQICNPLDNPETALGFSTDFSPITGKVVSVSPEHDTLVVREGRKAMFYAFSIQNLSQVPTVGDTVTITPYERRRFNGTKFSEPDEVALDSNEGIISSVTHLSNPISRIPGVPSTASSFLKEMVRQLEVLPADHRRTVAQVLVDSGAWKRPVIFQDIDDHNHQLPKITFHVELSGTMGTLTILLDRTVDTYTIELQLDDEDPKVYDDVVCEDIATIVNRVLVKDSSWLQDQVTIVKKAVKRKAS